MISEEQIFKIIEDNKNESIKFLQKMISFDSQVINQGLKGKEGKIQRWLAKELETVGCQVDLFEPDNKKIKKYSDFNPGHDYTNRHNVVGILRGEGKGRSLILNGHVDTVAIGDKGLWKYDPLEGRVEKGKIFGRGACDMKAGVAAIVMAVKCIKKANIKLSGDIIIQSVVDEEGGGNGTLACVDRGYRADAAIIPEPTGLKIMTTHRGAMHLSIRIKGKSTHACLKWEGVNAIEKMLKIMTGLSELEKEWLATKHHLLLPSPTIMFGQIKGGVGGSIVPAECELIVNIKYLPGENKKSVQKEVEGNIKSITKADSWLKKHPPEINWLLNTSPYETCSDHPIVKTIKIAVSKFIDKPEISGLPSGADARILNNIGGIPTVIFGPGSLSKAHSVDEYVSIDEYLTAIKILAFTVIEWVKDVL